MNKNRSNRLLKIILLIVFIFAALFMAFLAVSVYQGGGFSRMRPGAEQSSLVLNTEAPKLDDSQGTREEAEEKARERAAAKAEPGVVISGRPEILAEAGKDVIEGINLENNEKNAGRYYMSYEMRLLNDTPEGYEVLFSTDMIKPGNVVSDVKLSRPLEAGEYECVLHAQPYYIDTLARTNNADMRLLLVVK